MRFTNEVNWDETDFMVFGAMLAAACGTCELAARMTGNNAYQAAVGVALAAAFILVWMNLAVGIIGIEDNPTNLMFGGVPAVGISAPSSRASSRMEWPARWSRRRSPRRWSPWSR
jgi:hypothetical protein